MLKEEEERGDEVAGDGGMMVEDDRGVGGEEEGQDDGMIGEPGWRLVLFGSCLMVGSVVVVRVGGVEEKGLEMEEHEQDEAGSGSGLESAEAAMPVGGS